MKKLVLNLERREDRRKHFVENTNLTDWEFFDAIDGNLYDFKRLQAEGFSTFKAYRDPILNRKLTKGEIGCYLSHRALWIECLKRNEPILILEDDAIQLKDIDEEYCESLTEHYDFIYLNRNEMQKSKVKNIDDKLEVPSYPYNLTSYIITPTAATLLLGTDRDQHIMPVDEYVILCLPYFRTCAFKKNAFRQTIRQILPTDVENMWNQKDMWFVDFDTHQVDLSNDLDSLLEILETLDPDDVVFYSDKDFDPDDTPKEYLLHRRSIVFGDNNNCMGVVKAVIEILKNLGTENNVFHTAYNSNNYNMSHGPDLC